MSEDFLFVEVAGERNLLRNLEQMPDTVHAILLEKMQTLTERLEELVIEEIDEKTDMKTGRLISSVRSEVINEGGRIDGRVIIEAPYARILDKGGVTSPHIIYPKNGKVLAFIGATGDKVFATRVFHPGSTIPARHFTRDARRQIAPQISKAIKNAVVRGIRANMRKGR